MNGKREIRSLIAIAIAVAAAAAIPAEPAGDSPLIEAALLLRSYAREHIPFALLPALLVAGALSTFPQRAAIARRMGPTAPAPVAYGLAAIAGAMLAVCSCAVLPLFASLYLGGAGLGPAITLLYAGPAINVLAVTLTGSALGPELGVARAVAAIAFSVLIGLVMATLFRTHARRPPGGIPAPERPSTARRPWQTVLAIVLLAIAAISVNAAARGRLTIGLQCCVGGEVDRYVEGHVVARTANAITLRDGDGREHVLPKILIGTARGGDGPVARALHAGRYPLAVGGVLLAALLLLRWFSADERREWLLASWGLARKILPLLLLGVAATGLLLGRPQHGGLLPAYWVEAAVGATPEHFLEIAGWQGLAASIVRGGWPLWINFNAAALGALMYFASLTEVPIVGGLQGAGMARGPALAMLLAGPALSLPNLLVIRTILGTRKTLAYAGLVLIAATFSGLVYGAWT